MKIQQQDIYHGPALMQIVEHDSFKALNKVDNKYGHYLVNQDIRLWVKYSTARHGPWQFTFQSTDLTGIYGDILIGNQTHILLVCGHVSICSLHSTEFTELIDPKLKSTQWIKVEAPRNRQLHVTGSSSMSKKTPHSKFPESIFEG